MQLFLDDNVAVIAAIVALTAARKGLDADAASFTGHAYDHDASDRTTKGETAKQRQLRLKLRGQQMEPIALIARRISARRSASASPATGSAYNERLLQSDWPAPRNRGEGLGLMISFVEQTELAGPDTLSAHARWEVGYWKEHAARVDSATRRDLAGGRDDARVTELKLWNDAGKEMIIYLVGLRATDGVFAFGFSPAGASADAVVARFVRSLEIVHRPLSQTEIARISHSLKK